MNRIAVIGIIVEEPQEVEKLNQLLHEYGSYIIGRMGKGEWYELFLQQEESENYRRSNSRLINTCNGCYNSI